MKVVVIGATGHVGSYLVPRLVRAGHEVVAISRGERAPYHEDSAWSAVQRLTIDRAATEADGTFAERIAGLTPDAVIDMVCFTRSSAEHLVEGLRGRVPLLVSCGTIWVHGHLTEVPVTEDAVRRPWGDYGIGKAQIEELLHAESRRPGGLASVVLHPGHISGPGWHIINPAGNLDLSVWEALARGEELTLPYIGLETVHHVHADDVAQAFERALTASDAVGESFHVVSDRALTLRGFAEAVAGWFGSEAKFRFVSFDEFREVVGDDNANATWEHVSRSPSASIEKAKRVLGYAPRYSSLEAAADALAWLQRDGQVTLNGPVPTLVS
jgi:nucleoside-diphosphate-sugar epimerase